MDHYRTLGIDKSASQDDIKRAYRKLAAQHHPDRGGDTAKFQEIQAAYDVLGDPKKREEYDNPVSQGFQEFGGMPPGFDDLINKMFRNEGFESFFGRRPQPVKNRTLNLETKINLEDAFYGKKLIADIQLPSGRSQTLEVQIPAGVKDGTVLRLTGMGDDSISNVPRGDIHLTVRILPHQRFIRKDDDLILDYEINCIDAMLGKTIKVETIDNKILETQIPSGIQNGKLIGLSGYGMPNIQNTNVKGKLLLQITIKIPMLTDQQKDQLRKILN